MKCILLMGPPPPPGGGNGQGPPGPPGGGPPCLPAPCVPIDGGIAFLLTLGLLYAIFKLKRKRNEKRKTA